MRYLPLTPEDRASMLATIGAKSADDFYADVPKAARLKAKIAGLPDHQGELAVERHMTKLAAKNRSASSGPFFVGAGAYKHHVPATVDMIIHNLTQNAKMAQQVIANAVEQLPIARGCECARALATAIITRPEHVPAATRERLKPIMGKYF